MLRKILAKIERHEEKYKQRIATFKEGTFEAEKVFLSIVRKR